MAPEEGRTMYLGSSAAIGGLAGFASTIIGSLIVKRMEGYSTDFIGIHIGNLQIVFILSGMLLLLKAIYVHVYMHDPKKAEAIIE